MSDVKFWTRLQLGVALGGTVLYAVAGVMPYGKETRRRAAGLIKQLPGLPKMEKVHEYCDGIIGEGAPPGLDTPRPPAEPSSPHSDAAAVPAAPSGAGHGVSAPVDSWANDEWDKDRELTFRGSAAFLSACHMVWAVFAWRRLKRD